MHLFLLELQPLGQIIWRRSAIKIRRREQELTKSDKDISRNDLRIGQISGISTQALKQAKYLIFEFLYKTQQKSLSH